MLRVSRAAVRQCEQSLSTRICSRGLICKKVPIFKGLSHIRAHRARLKLSAKGFCRAKFWAKFPFWRGAVRGEVFREVCREVLHEVFGLVLLGHSEQ